jgi:hypothetical protein
MSIDRSLGTMSRPAWSPDSTRLAFSQVTADRTSTTLTVLDVSTAQRGLYPVDTFEAETFSSAPVWSPNGTTIAVQQTSPEPAQSALVLLDVAGGQITTHIGTQPRTFSGMLLWSPDSQRLVSVNRSSTSLFTPTDHSVVTSSDCLGSEVNHVNWSPDSQWVAHHRSYNGRYAHGFVCLMSLAGETIRISVGGNASNPVWSADSQSLMLAVTTLPENAAFPDAPPRAPDPRLLRFDLATRRLARITALPQGTGAVVGWIHPSPDQQAIAIAYPRPDPILTLVDPTTAVSTTSPLSVALKYTPRPFLSWSGDAGQLFFVTTATSDDPKQHAGHIYRYDLQDNSFTRLVETGEIVAWTVAPEIQAQATVPTATSTATPTATPTPSPTALPTALPTPRPTSAVPPDQSIRSTDWEALIGVQNTPLPHYLLDRIAYADLDGDGVEEAILPYYSGGTAGILYFSIFCQTASGPVEVGRVDGYKAGIDLQDGYLIRTTTVYAGWEANCCPSGLLLTGYTLRGAVLEPVAEWRMGDIVMVRDVLSWYFSSWRLRRYFHGYRLLDDATRSQVPYDEWRRQQDRQRIEPDEDVDITFTPPLTTINLLQPLGTVLTATITMTGQYTLPGGRLETRHYTGTWPIAYRPFAIEHSNGYVNEGYGWVILTDTLHLVPEPPPTATPRPTQTATRTPRPTHTPIPTPTKWGSMLLRGFRWQMHFWTPERGYVIINPAR